MSDLKPVRVIAAAVLAIVTFLVPVAKAQAADAPLPLVPQPASVRTIAGDSFTFNKFTQIQAPLTALSVGNYLAQVLRPSTGYVLPVTPFPAAVRLSLGGPSSLGAEGYRLDVRHSGVQILARTPAGLFYGVQTLRQLLPPRVESRTKQPGPWTVPGVQIADSPRFAWRGAMLDVARHFFPLQQVENYVDLLSMYKINTLHLHLSDNDGWRIEIKSWPRLATYGGSTQAGGGPGGYYTQSQYKELIRYAASRFVTIIPEIDTPGHVTAALASYGPLNCDGKAPPLLSPGWSSLCVNKPVTYKFLDDVVRELAAITPGPYLHMGGDEAINTPPADYVAFVSRIQQIVHSHGKQLLGWHQIEEAPLTGQSVAQYWGTAGSPDDEALALRAKQRGNKLVMSPADKIYLDMKYDASTPVGQDWAGYNSVSDAYDWDPATFVTGIADSDLSGVEAPLWTDIQPTMADVQFMTFPRLPGVAEIGWSPQSTHSWAGYRPRLAAQTARWDVLGVRYYASPEL